MNPLRRPSGRGISREKVGIVGALAALLGWAVTEYFGVELDEETLLAIATLILAAVQWRSRNRRAEP